MTKCDFCTSYDPVEKCYWDSHSSGQERDCEKAIQRMEKALASIGTAIQPMFVTGTSMEGTHCRTPVASTTYYTNNIVNIE